MSLLTRSNKNTQISVRKQYFQNSFQWCNLQIMGATRRSENWKLTKNVTRSLFTCPGSFVFVPTMDLKSSRTFWRQAQTPRHVPRKTCSQIPCCNQLFGWAFSNKYKYFSKHFPTFCLLGKAIQMRWLKQKLKGWRLAPTTYCLSSRNDFPISKKPRMQGSAYPSLQKVAPDFANSI